MAKRKTQQRVDDDSRFVVEQLESRIYELEGDKQRVEASAAETVALGDELAIARNDAEVALRMVQAHERTIRELTLSDPLTGLANRNEFQRQIVDAINFAKREGTMVALMLLDLDHFKTINDSFGHPVGDELLKFFASQLLEITRETDTVARLGGDEFAVIMPHVKNLSGVVLVAERVINKLAEPANLDGSLVASGTSVGIALYPRDGDDVEDLLRTSDQALYEAKKRGRGTYQFFDVSINEKARAARILENDIRLGIVRDEFFLTFQPQLLATTGDIICVEALARWCHPVRGLIMPGDFIAAAEENGLICDIGRDVIVAACKQAVAWQNAGFKPFQIAVNISPRQFLDNDLLSIVQAALAETGLDSQYLELEITESVMMDNTTQAIEKLHHLRDLGVSLSVDDFGTGYSSLAYLKQFPIQKLKVDQSFTRNVSTDPTDAAICEAVISLGDCLGVEVVAEGTETKEQIDILVDKGCTRFQGYYFGRPATAADFTDGLVSQTYGKTAQAFSLANNTMAAGATTFA
jgi:diguanylate cyclase (GGDEF)-like protein